MPTHPEWVTDAIFYQIFPDRFRNGDKTNDPTNTAPWGSPPTRDDFMGGDIEGMIQSLDYILELGCNAIYLNPIFHARTNHRYDTSDYYRIDPALGTDETFDRLVAEAHQRGIRLILDGVFNHCGLGFAPFQDVLARGEASDFRDWFDIYDFPVRMEPEPNYATCGLTDYLPRLNAHHPEVATFAQDVALHWLERGIDGWRLDVPYEIHPEFWQVFRSRIKQHFPDAYLVAEEWRDPAPLLKGDTFDGAMHYRLKDLIFDFLFANALTGEAFLRALEQLRSTLPTGSETGMLTLLGSHDTERVLTAAGGDVALVKQAFAALFTLPGAPMILYGDEIGLTGSNDPDCRRSMEWEPEAWNQELQSAVVRLAQARSATPSLRTGGFASVFGNDRIAAFFRGAATPHAEDGALVLLNSGRSPRTISIPVPFPSGTTLRDVLSAATFEVEQRSISFEPLLPKRCYVLTASDG